MGGPDMHPGENAISDPKKGVYGFLLGCIPEIAVTVSKGLRVGHDGCQEHHRGEDNDQTKVDLANARVGARHLRPCKLIDSPAWSGGPPFLSPVTGFSM